MSYSNSVPPPAYLRPENISQRPNPDGVIYVETAAPMPTSTSTAMPPPAMTSAAAGSSSHSDLAGVLRRNQACLNCRRRKLKCDAIRPHCGTCVRSYKHALRTSPKSNPVMACEYDEESGTAPPPAPGTSANGDSALADEEEGSQEGERKRKRKSNANANGAGSGRKKSSEDEDASRANLVRQELEAQIQARNGQSQAGYPHTSAPSPTALLDLLSSTASAQASAQPSGGLKNGVADNVMMTGDQSTGLTPMFVVDDPMSAARPPMPELQNSTSTESTTSRRTSDIVSNPASSGPSILSPYHLLNLSPAPTSDAEQFDKDKMSNPWLGPGLQPSTRIDGPWKAVETTETIFAAASAANTGTKIDSDGIPLDQIPLYPQVSTDGFINDPTNILGADGYMMDDVSQQRLLMDLFWPGWPPNVPEPNIVNDLIESFFNLVPNLPRMMHRPRLLARMALPPTHQNFPHPALLHAICSCASLWCAPAVYSSSTMCTDFNPFITSQPGYAGKFAKSVPTAGNLSFSATQANFAKEAIQEGLTTGHKLLDVVRAIIILSRVFIDETRMLECWTYSGLASRMIIPLGLNVRSAELSMKSVMLPPPADALEREERRATVWMAFYHDTIGSAASGWGSSMSIDELTVPFPASADDFDSGKVHIESNPQDLDSLDLWTKHPVADAFVLCMKATVLLNRVNRFVRKWKNRRLRDDDDLEGMQRPEFRELANAISCLQMSFPPHMRNPCRPGSRGKLEIELIAAHLLPHMATICLYEPFSDVTDPTDPSTRRLASATTAIVSIVQEIAMGSGGQVDFSTVMHSSASVALTTAARTSVVFYRQALNIGDFAQVETHRMDIEVVRMALAQFGTRFKIGYHHAQLIEYFLDRSSNPTFEKLAAHYPEHPRPGAPELHANADLGRCIINALNIKRGYWRLPRPAQGQYPQQPAGISPFGSTPDGSSSSNTNGTADWPGFPCPVAGSGTGTVTGDNSQLNVAAAAASAGPGGAATGGPATDSFTWCVTGHGVQQKTIPTVSSRDRDKAALQEFITSREKERGPHAYSSF